jgi:hypothetical protein
MRYKFLFLLWIASFVGISQRATTQFLEAAVQKLEGPVDGPDFTLRTLGDGKTSPKGLRGEIVLLTLIRPFRVTALFRLPLSIPGPSSFVQTPLY